MKAKLLIILGCIGLLAGCNALEGKCNYLPPDVDNCGCSKSPFDPTYYSCNCKEYLRTKNKENINHCGSCSCVNDTCSNCWSCGKNYNFHDQ